MAILGELQYALISNPGTVIGTLVPHVTVEEVYRDEVITTDHPVETGAAISDHAFKRPSSIEIRCGWSNGTARSVSHAAQVYQQMLSVQEQSRKRPVDISTPRRLYRNMVLGGIQVQRDEKTDNVLSCSIAAREVIMVTAQSTGGSDATQADPASTGSITDQGTISTKPGPGYDFSNMNAGVMGDTQTGSFQTGINVGSAGGYDAAVPSTPGNGYNFSGINAGSFEGGQGSFAQAPPLEAGGLAGFDEITFTTPDGVSTTIPGPGMSQQAGPGFAILGAEALP